MVKVNNMQFLNKQEKELVIYKFVKELEELGLIDLFDDGLFSLSEKLFKVFCASSVFDSYALVKIDSKDNIENMEEIKLFSMREKDILVNKFIRTLIKEDALDILHPELRFDYDKLSALEHACMIFDQVSFLGGIEQLYD